MHSYGKSFNGFAARLHPEHAEKIKGYFSCNKSNNVVDLFSIKLPYALLSFIFGTLLRHNMHCLSNNENVDDS